MESNHPSVWTRTSEQPSYPRLETTVDVDVAIVGGGLTGITAGILLKDAGYRVAVLEAREIAGGVTGFTTAHITEVLDTRYHVLARKFGRAGARLAASSQRTAIERIAAFVERYRLDCAFRWLPGWLYAEQPGHVDELQREFEAARDAGLQVSMQNDAPLPFRVAAALRFEGQAQFHPRDYVLPLAARLPGGGSHVFEQTRVLDVVDDEPCRVRTEHGAIVTARRVLLCTHHPINKVFLHTKVAAYRSYVVTARVRGELPDGLFWDTEDPYHYLRAARDERGPLLLVGGEDHKVAEQAREAASFERLEEYVQERFDCEELVDRWSAQVLEPVDGLPYIGRNAAASHCYVATGYSGNGMTNATVAAMLLVDLVMGRANPWADLYEATRVKPLASMRKFLGENKDFPKHLVGDRLRRAEARSVEEVAPGQGRLVQLGGRTLAVYRSEAGELSALSPVCTHLYCHVQWNDAEHTWDCPCHGSRYDTSGEVIDGPAVRALERRPLPGEPREEPERRDEPEPPQPSAGS